MLLHPMDLSGLLKCFVIIYQYLGSVDYNCDFPVRSDVTRNGIFREDKIFFRPVVPTFPVLRHGQNYSVTPYCMTILDTWNHSDSIVSDNRILVFSALFRFCRVLPISTVNGYSTACSNTPPILLKIEPSPMVYDVVLGGDHGRPVFVQRHHDALPSVAKDVRCYIWNGLYRDSRVHVMEKGVVHELLDRLRHFFSDIVKETLLVIVRCVGGMIFESVQYLLFQLLGIFEPVVNYALHYGVFEISCILLLLVRSRIGLWFSLPVFVGTAYLHFQTKHDLHNIDHGF